MPTLSISAKARDLGNCCIDMNFGSEMTVCVTNFNRQREIGLLRQNGPADQFSKALAGVLFC